MLNCNTHFGEFAFEIIAIEGEEEAKGRLDRHDTCQR